MVEKRRGVLTLIIVGLGRGGEGTPPMLAFFVVRDRETAELKKVWQFAGWRWTRLDVIPFLFARAGGLGGGGDRCSRKCFGLVGASRYVLIGCGCFVSA